MQEKHPSESIPGQAGAPPHHLCDPRARGCCCALLPACSEISGHENQIWARSVFGKECHRERQAVGGMAPSPSSHSSFPVSATGEIGRGSAWRPEQPPPLSPALCNPLTLPPRVWENSWQAGAAWGPAGLGKQLQEHGRAPRLPLHPLQSPTSNLSNPCLPPELGWGGQILLRADLTAQSCFDAKLHPDASRKSRELQQPGAILSPSASPQSCLKTQTLEISWFY